MRERLSAYPLKIISRSLPELRANRLRLSWFVLGAAFGIGSALAFAPPRMTMPQEASIAPIMTPSLPPITASAAAPTPTPKKEAAVPKTAILYPVTLNLKIENGDTLITLLTDAGVSKAEAYSVLEAMHKTYNPKRLDIGQTITVRLESNPDKPGTPLIQKLIVPSSATTSVAVIRTAHGYDIKKLNTPVDRKLTRLKSHIEGSLYETGIQGGLPPVLLQDIINAYSYDVDFQRDIKHGDLMDVVYERLETEDGVKAGFGNVVYAELDTGARVLRIYRYVDKNGHADYYTAKGESVRKAMMRTPINGAQITSGYGMRIHPLLGYSKMHRGVDFGAPEGTPIYAAGDGTIEAIGQRGGYGNYLRIKHTNKYASAYAHISKFAHGMAEGVHVKQGQIIAYVGQTGMATGPHLHYEILVNGEQVNPANVKFKTGNALSGKELAAFRKNIEKLQAALGAMPKGGTELAMAEITR